MAGIDVITLTLAKKFAMKISAGYSSVEVDEPNSALIFTLNDGKKATLHIPQLNSIEDIYTQSFLSDEGKKEEHVIIKLTDGSIKDIGKLPEQKIKISKEKNNALIEKSDGYYVSQSGSLSNDIVSEISIGSVTDSTVFRAGEPIETVLKAMLTKTEEIIDNKKSTYYGVADTEITKIDALTETKTKKEMSIVVSPKNQYVIIACPQEAGVPIITSFGFNYTDSFTSVAVNDYVFYYSKTKITNSNFEYTITYS